MDYNEVRRRLNYMLSQRRIRSQLQNLNSFEECMTYDWFSCVTNPLFFLFEIENVIRLIIYIDNSTMELCLGDYLLQPRDDSDCSYSYSKGINNLGQFARKADGVLDKAYIWNEGECELAGVSLNPFELRDSCSLEDTDKIKSIPGLFSLDFDMINLLFDDFKDAALERLDLLESTDNLFCEQTFLSDDILNEWDIFSKQKTSDKFVILKFPSAIGSYDGYYVGGGSLDAFIRVTCDTGSLEMTKCGVYLMPETNAQLGTFKTGKYYLEVLDSTKVECIYC